VSVAFPLFVLERDSGDVMRFNSVAEMQKQLERIDVENAEYLAWESREKAGTERKSGDRRWSAPLN
jgi:hypothetical protein